MDATTQTGMTDEAFEQIRVMLRRPAMRTLARRGLLVWTWFSSCIVINDVKCTTYRQALAAAKPVRSNNDE